MPLVGVEYTQQNPFSVEELSQCVIPFLEPIVWKIIYKPRKLINIPLEFKGYSAKNTVTEQQ